MVTLNVALALSDAESVTVTVSEKGPAVVGVPEIVPAFTVRPGASPESDQEYGGVPPVAPRAAEGYAVPTCPFGNPVVVIERGDGEGEGDGALGLPQAPGE